MNDIYDINDNSAKGDSGSILGILAILAIAGGAGYVIWYNHKKGEMPWANFAGRAHGLFGFTGRQTMGWSGRKYAIDSELENSILQGNQLDANEIARLKEVDRVRNKIHSLQVYLSELSRVVGFDGRNSEAARWLKVDAFENYKVTPKHTNVGVREYSLPNFNAKGARPFIHSR
jgi:hypothetical protein